MSKSTLKILPALMAAITAALVTQSVYGVPDHQFVLTENSSTILSATFDGAPLTVTSIGNPDGWFVTTPDVTLPQSLFVLDWFEPGSTSSFNGGAQFLSTTNFLVESDQPFFGGGNEPNGFTYVDAGTLTSDGVGIDVTLNDNGDTAAVPEPTVIGLLSVGALLFWRRKKPS